MPVNKVVYGNNTLIDITDTTATPSDVALGKTFYQADGTMAQGLNNRGNVDESKDVWFIDYDGTLLYTYTAEEFAALNELPPNPHRVGLIAQGWNWELNEAQAYVAKYGGQVIGQNYVTDDGKTRIYITIEDGGTSDYMPFRLRLSCTVPGGSVINWGDGTSTTTYSSTSYYVYNHGYSNAGDYVVSIESNEGAINLQGVAGSSSGYTIYGSRSNDNCYNSSRIRKVEFGNNVNTLGTYTFAECIGLESISLSNSLVHMTGDNIFANARRIRGLVVPKSIDALYTGLGFVELMEVVSIPNCKTIDTSGAINKIFGTTSRSLKRAWIPELTSTGISLDGMFNGARQLKKIVIPEMDVSSCANFAVSCNSLTECVLSEGLSSIGGSAFSEDCLLKNIMLPSTVTSIGGNAFSNCFSLKNIELPEGITEITTTTFNGCRTLIKLTIPSTVTTISGNAFGGCYSLVEVHLKSTTPITIVSNAFPNMRSNFVIYVPYSADHSILDAYKNDPSLSTYTSRFREEPQEQE